MNKTISVFILGAIFVSCVLSACDVKTNNESETDINSEIIEVIEKSQPISDGNLITKTNTEKDGSINVEYFDNNDNLVEQYVWKDDDKISHSVMTYTEDNMIMTKEEISPDGQSNTVYSYQYDSDNNISQTTKSLYENGLIKKSETYNNNDEITGSAEYIYNAENKLSQIKRYDESQALLEYFTYEYMDNGMVNKYSSYSADGEIKKYTTFEYNEDSLPVLENYFDGDDKKEYSIAYDYYESGAKKSSTQYDSNGNIISQTTYNDE